MICPRCNCEFHAKPFARRKYCSRPCKEATQRRIDLAKFAQLASEGAKAAYMAAVFGVSNAHIANALRRHGLHSRWKEKRYA